MIPNALYTAIVASTLAGELPPSCEKLKGRQFLILHECLQREDVRPTPEQCEEAMRLAIYCYYERNPISRREMR